MFGLFFSSKVASIFKSSSLKGLNYCLVNVDAYFEHESDVKDIKYTLFTKKIQMHLMYVCSYKLLAYPHNVLEYPSIVLLLMFTHALK